MQYKINGHTPTVAIRTVESGGYASNVLGGKSKEGQHEALN